MLRTRVITALVLLLLLAGTAALSAQAVVALGALFLGFALYEWLRLCPLPTALAAGLGALLALAGLATEFLGWQLPQPVLAALCALACLLWLGIGLLLVRAQRAPLTVPPVVLVGAALLLAGTAWLALARLLHTGQLWTLSVLALVWLADIAAYFTGRAFGSAKLASRISPGKTWAGVWGALAAVLLLAAALAWVWPQPGLWSTRLLQAAPLAGLALLAVLVVLSIVGDLFESLVKRQAGVKDSGWVLPGHGGVWDRIDATLPVLPLAVLAQWLLMPGMNLV